jgi:hypothetical protein
VSAREALRTGLREPRLVHAFVGIAFAASAMGVQQVLAPIHLTDEGLSSAAIGWIWTLGAALSVTVAMLVGRRLDRIDKRANARTGVVFVSCIACYLALGLPAAAYSLGLIASFGLATLIWTTVYPLCSEAAEQAGIGQGVAMGALNTVWAAASVMAPITAGALAGLGVPAVGYLAIAVFGVICARVLRQRTLAPAPGTA